MKTFKRASLPEAIKYNGKTYNVDVSLSAGYGIEKSSTLPAAAIKVEVMSRRI